MRVGRVPYVPAEDREKQPMSPAEAMLAAAEPELFETSEPLTAEEDVIHLPWYPTGDETPKRTIKAADDLEHSPPPTETAGGSIPSAYAQFRKWGPDES